MITIKTTSKDNAELVIKKGTPFITMLLGIEMLVEALMKDSNINHFLPSSFCYFY